MHLINEEDLLNIEFRRRVIDEITGSENVARKQRELIKHEIYRDKTVKWVIDALRKEGLKEKTIAQMQTRASNISICRKIVNKLARCYTHGVKRTFEGESSQQAADALTELMELNTKLKKTDRFRQLHKNAMLQVVPELVPDEEKYKLKMKVLAPWSYDVIEDPYDHEIPKCVILTDFTERFRSADYELTRSLDPVKRGAAQRFGSGNQIDETIADSPEDQGYKQRLFIWWGKTYHFTTDAKGEYVTELSPDEFLNPIGMLPFANVADDQDGEFWAQGGNDLVDGSILINQMITDRNAIAYIQGWGQLVITGKNIPKVLEGGPHNALIFEQENIEEKVDVFYVQANPPLDAWERAIEQYTALLLSTNDLAPSNIAGKLDATVFPSGIAALVEHSQASGSIEDKQKLFIDVEKQLWSVIQKWQNLYFDQDLLIEEFKEAGKLENADVMVTFTNPQQVVTEQEKLANLKARKELGLDRMVDLLMLDKPDLSEEEAQARLVELETQRMKKIEETMARTVEGMMPDDEEKEAIEPQANE